MYILCSSKNNVYYLQANIVKINNPCKNNPVLSQILRYISNLNKTWLIINKFIGISKIDEFPTEFRVGDRYLTDNKAKIS